MKEFLNAPKEPIQKEHHGFETYWAWHCPNCDKQFGEEIYDDDYNYCQKCGQQLDKFVIYEQ